MLVQGVFLFLIYFRVFHKPIFHIFHTLPQKGFSLVLEAKQSGSCSCFNAFSASSFSSWIRLIRFRLHDMFGRRAPRQ